MINNPTSVIEIPITDGDLWVVQKMAIAAAIGGRSQVRGGDTRMDCLMEDQFVGQIATLAFYKYHFGQAGKYIEARWHQNRTPLAGDGGHDIPAANIDVKGSRMRGSPDPMDYRLLVRPLERHPRWIYVLALVPKGDRCVLLMGWKPDEDLPQEPEREGSFIGAHVVPAKELERLPPIRWEWFFE